MHASTPWEGNRSLAPRKCKFPPPIHRQSVRHCGTRAGGRPTAISSVQFPMILSLYPFFARWCQSYISFKFSARAVKNRLRILFIVLTEQGRLICSIGTPSKRFFRINLAMHRRVKALPRLFNRGYLSLHLFLAKDELFRLVPVGSLTPLPARNKL